MNQTLQFYDETAKEYFEKTYMVNMEEQYQRFLKYIPNSGSILDLGCGSGRDSFYFKEKEYQIDAIDGSHELAILASDFTGISVDFIDFSKNMYLKKSYHGIWACASLLHLSKERFSSILQELKLNLNENGIFYISLKTGKSEELYEGERFFSYYLESELLSIIDAANYAVCENYKTEDGLSRGIEWINLLLKKK